MFLVLLATAGLALVVAAAALALTRRARDEMSDTVHSFDDFREALSPRVGALGDQARALGERLDRGPRGH